MYTRSVNRSCYFFRDLLKFLKRNANLIGFDQPATHKLTNIINEFSLLDFTQRYRIVFQHSHSPKIEFAIAETLRSINKNTVRLQVIFTFSGLELSLRANKYILPIGLNPEVNILSYTPLHGLPEYLYQQITKKTFNNLWKVESGKCKSVESKIDISHFFDTTHTKLIFHLLTELNKTDELSYDMKVALEVKIRSLVFFFSSIHKLK